MVAEHDERMVEACKERPQASLAARVRDEVSRDADELGSPLRDPLHGALARTVAARERRAEVEVGEMPDANAVERLGQPVERHLEHSLRSQPASIQP